LAVFNMLPQRGAGGCCFQLRIFRPLI